MKKLSIVPATIAGFLIMISLLYLAVISFTFNTASYPQSPPYDAMAVELVDYLSGSQAELTPELFTERELLHMVDVLDLFEGGKRIALVCLAVFAVCSAITLFTGGRSHLGSGLLIGMAVFVGLMLAVGVWALVDFTSWFTTMHELVFTNDLWLLDPAESMLIRMLPLDFFIGAVKSIAWRYALDILLVLLAAILLKLPRKRRLHGLP